MMMHREALKHMEEALQATCCPFFCSGCFLSNGQTVCQGSHSTVQTLERSATSAPGCQGMSEHVARRNGGSDKEREDVLSEGKLEHGKSKQGTFMSRKAKNLSEQEVLATSDKS